MITYCEQFALSDANNYIQTSQADTNMYNPENEVPLLFCTNTLYFLHKKIYQKVNTHFMKLIC
jgi:hypothetical protein